jgi:hypothetical protein
MTDEQRRPKKERTYRDRVETEVRNARSAVKGVEEEPQTTAARHMQIATTYALLDLADAIRNGGSVG